MDKVRRVACLLTTGVPETPLYALNTLLNLKPLSLFVEEQAARCAQRLNDLGQLRNQVFGYSVILKYVENIGGRVVTSDYISPRLDFESRDIPIPKRDIWTRMTPPFS